MLILTRSVGETIVIGSDIRIVMVEPRGNQVRIGVDTPREVRVVRKELLERDVREIWPPVEEGD